MKTYVMGAGLLVLLTGVWAAFGYQSRSKPAVPPAALDVVSPVKTAGKVLADGTLVPAQSAALSFPTAGTVVEVLVTEGSSVQAGQVLARLSGEQERSSVVQAEAQFSRVQARLNELNAGPRPQEIAVAKADVDAAEAKLASLQRPVEPQEVADAAAELNRAEEQLKLAAQSSGAQDIAAAKTAIAAAMTRYDKLRRGAMPDQIAVAQADVRKARAQLEMKQAGERADSIAAAKADVVSAVQALAQAKARLADTELKAPFSGTVATVNLKAGEFFTPGVAVIRLADLSGWLIETNDLSERSVAQIREGSVVTITFDAIPGLEIPGEVSRIKGWGEKKVNDITYTVVVKPHATDERFRWQMKASVTIQAR